MDLIGYFAEFGPWAWVVGGIVLLAIELVAPGGIFVWLGAAAILTGVISLFQPIGTAFQWALFGVLSIAAIVAWLNFTRRRAEPESDRPWLNRRAEGLIGKELVLKDAISGGYGRAEVGDSLWRVSGPELPAGTHVRVVGTEGVLLRVEPTD